MIGLAIQGTNANGGDSTAVFGLENKAGTFAQIRVMGDGADWPGYKGVSTYDRTGYTLKIVKEGTTITYFINGTKACSWTSSDYNFAGWTNVKVGIGFYRMYDVTFSDYSYKTTVRQTVSGTVAGNLSGTVTATNLALPGLTYTASVTNGAYAIDLPDGEYKLYFDCGTTEGLIPSVTVDGAAVSAPTLAKTYQKLTAAKYGSADYNGVSALLDNGVYQISGVTDGNANAAANFAGTYNNFVVKTHVKSANGQVGIIMHGVDGYGNGVQINLQSNGYLSFYGWDTSWQGGGNVAGYNAEGFDLTIVHKDATVYVFIDDVLVKTWVGTAGNIALSKLTDLQVGLLVRGTVGATYSDYSISGEAADIDAALSKTLTYENLPEGVTVSAASGSMLAGTEVTISGMSAEGAIYFVTLNGQKVTVTDGKVTFKLNTDTELTIAVAYNALMSGTVEGAATGTVTATDLATGEVTTAEITGGSYAVRLPNGEYKLYFDCGEMEGLIPALTSAGVDVTVPALKLYQKPTVAKIGTEGTANWVLTGNGRYEVQTSDSGGNVISTGYFAIRTTLHSSILWAVVKNGPTVGVMG